MKLLKIITLSTIFFLSACASDGVIETPRLSLNPKLLIDKSEFGVDKTIKLTILNQIRTKSTSEYGYETNLRELFTELFTDAFEKVGFNVETDADADIPSGSTYMTIVLLTADNEVNANTLKSEVLGHLQLQVKVKKLGLSLTQNFESHRSQEVALKANIRDVEAVMDQAITQIITRVINNTELKTFISK